MIQLNRERARTGESTSTSDEQLPVGSNLGRFRIVRHLGRGGMGAVYEAEDTLLERQVAMKVVALLGSRGRERMLAEARALAMIKHANVVQLYDVGIDQDRVYLALELVRGTTLARWLKAETRDWKDILVHFVAAGRGLAEAHDAELAHGDFKPSNVLVATDGRILVSDFGLAQSMESETTEPIRVTNPDRSTSPEGQRIVGTPAYMAPELFRGAHKDAATDLFAFCVALYEALFAQHPFGGGSWHEVAKQIGAGKLRPPPRKSKVPRHVRQAVMRGLERRAARRWPSMRALLEQLTNPPARGLGRLGVALGVASVGVVALSVANASDEHPQDPCGPPSELAQAAWDTDVRTRIAVAYAGSGDSGAGHIATELDQWSTDWLEARQTVCEASRDDRHTGEELDAGIACLRRARISLQLVTGGLSAALPRSIDVAMSKVASLPQPSACADLVR